MKVVKFGGSSQCKDGYTKLLDLINESFKTSDPLIIVLSAVSGVTNLLNHFLETKDIKYIGEVVVKNKQLIEELLSQYIADINIDMIIEILYELVTLYQKDDSDPHLKSQILGFGEILSTNIFYQLIREDRPQVVLGNSYEFIKSVKETSKLYPSVEFTCSPIIHDYFDKGCHVLITQGFIASTPSGKPIILGRGGSDTTGALIAQQVKASEYQVWSDVDGIYSADPRMISEAMLMPEISYQLVQEMAGMGAKVMHPYSILPCQIGSIPIKLFNTFSDNTQNTIIKDSDKKAFCVTSQKNTTLFKITSMCMWEGSGFMCQIFEYFKYKRINVDIISSSQHSIWVTTNETNMSLLKELIEDLSEKFIVDVSYDKVTVSLVSNNLIEYEKHIEIPRTEYLLRHKSPNDLTVSYVIDAKKAEHLMKYIHDFFL